MKKPLIKTLLATALLSSSLGAASIAGAGASFPANIYMSWTKSYEKATGNQINYQSIGSGGGIKQVKSGTLDFGASDEPLKPDELSKSNLLQFPTLTGAIVIVYHLNDIKDGELKLSNEVLSDIFLGNITKWNDAKIKKDNPTLSLPDKAIQVIHRSDGSGTTYNFTLFLSQISKAWNDKIGYGKAISWAIGTGAKGNEGVSALIKQTQNSISYVELSYKQQMNLSAAQIQTTTKKWVQANEQSISNASKNAKWDKKQDFYTLLVNQSGDNTYPLVNATFILLPKNAKNTPEVVKFFDYAFANGDKEALKMGFVPLPQTLKNQIKEYFKENGL